jgi:thermopsin
VAEPLPGSTVGSRGSISGKIAFQKYYTTPGFTSDAMRAFHSGLLLALVVTVTMVLAPVAGAGVAMPSSAVSPAGLTGAAVTSTVPGSAAGIASAAAAPNNIASEMASQALAATSKAGLSPSVISVPRPSASAAEITQAKSVGHVTPLYTGVPAPVGLAYYGLRESPNGSIAPSILNTTSLRGQIAMKGAGIQPLDLFASSPDSFGMQLNAVATNITLFGTHGYSFWTQNVVLYYAHANFMILVTNVWNFSGQSISPNALYASGTTGVDDFSDYGSLGYYYSELVVPIPVVSPFVLSLYMNSSIIGGRNAVNFTVGVASVAHPSEDFTDPYDYVVFNSTAARGAPLTVPSNYTASGYSYNPLGLTDDYELILGGPNGGSNADIATADATLGLAYWDATTNSYRATPSAFNYGGETGETVTGANVAWASGTGGPSQLARYGTLTGGPTVLRGLWNAGAPDGSVPLTIDVTPANAFDVFTPVNSSSTALRNFLSAEPIAAPGVYGDTFWLTPGTYGLNVGLSDYTPFSATVTVTMATTIIIHLRENTREGVYTPLWAFSNAQLAAISSSGSGTAASPYILFDNQGAPLSDVYGLYNDYVFPVFPGVFLHGTSASVALFDSASFTTKTNDHQYPGSHLPATNELQFWFWGVTHVALVDSVISGWFGSSAYYPVDWDTFNVIFYASSHNLIAGNHFATQGQALLMFSGGTIFGPLNIGGGNNTVWGNRFTEGATPNSTISVAPVWSGFDVGLGIELAEQNDLIYNNYFATPTTAWMLPLNLYSGDSFLYTETWNIAAQPAFIPHYVAGFPLFPLSGSIVGSRDQGGNFWWDYGNSASSPNKYNGAVNPVGSLPYNENASTVNAYSLTPVGGTLLLYIYGIDQPTFIYNGGDFAPLVPPHHQQA